MPHVLERVLTLVQDLSFEMTGSVGSAINNLELCIEAGEKDKKHLDRARKLCIRGIEQARMLLAVTSNLRTCVISYIETEPKADDLPVFNGEVGDGCASNSASASSL